MRKKLVVLFLGNGGIQQWPIWRTWLASHHVDIFIHDHALLTTASTPPEGFAAGRGSGSQEAETLQEGKGRRRRIGPPEEYLVESSKRCYWGDLNPCVHELLSTALDNTDDRSAWFALVSDSTIPLTPSADHLLHDLEADPFSSPYSPLSPSLPRSSSKPSWSDMSRPSRDAAEAGVEIPRTSHFDLTGRPMKIEAHDPWCQKHSQWWILTREDAQLLRESSDYWVPAPWLKDPTGKFSLMPPDEYAPLCTLSRLNAHRRCESSMSPSIVRPFPDESCWTINNLPAQAWALRPPADAPFVYPDFDYNKDNEKSKLWTWLWANSSDSLDSLTYSFPQSSELMSSKSVMFPATARDKAKAKISGVKISEVRSPGFDNLKLHGATATVTEICWDDDCSKYGRAESDYRPARYVSLRASALEKLVRTPRIWFLRKVTPYTHVFCDLPECTGGRRGRVLSIQKYLNWLFDQLRQADFAGVSSAVETAKTFDQKGLKR